MHRLSPDVRGAASTLWVSRLRVFQTLVVQRKPGRTGEAQGRACFNQPISEGPTPLSRRCCLGWMLLALMHALIVLAFNGEEGEYGGPRSCRGSLPTSYLSLHHERPQSPKSSEVDLVGRPPASGMASSFRSFQVTLCFRKNSLQKPLLKLLSNSFSEESEAKLAGLSAQPASQLAGTGRSGPSRVHTGREDP